MPERARDSLEYLGYRLENLVRLKISRNEAKLNVLAAGLIQLDPQAVLNRGYALARGPDGRPVRDAASLQPGDSIGLTFASGSAKATIDRVVASPKAQ